MTFKGRSVGGVAAASLMVLATGLAFGPAASAQVDFGYNGCDGYSYPTYVADGMIPPASAWGMMASPTFTNRDDKAIRHGRAGVEACDKAFADLPRVEKHHPWPMRRAVLLRARAQHDLEAGDVTAALADLDQAETVARPFAGQQWFARSLGVNLALTRAVAFNMAGRQGETEALIRQAVAARPYDSLMQWSALAALGPKGDPALMLALLTQAARLDARALPALILANLDASRFDAVVTLYPQMAANGPNADLEAADAAGAYAYALAVGGRGAEARAALAEAQARLPGQGGLLGGWARAVDLRLQLAAGMTPSQVRAALATPSRTAADPDLLRALARAAPEMADQLNAAADDIAAKRRARGQALDMATVFAMAPGAEAPSNRPPYSNAPMPIMGDKSPEVVSAAQGWRVTDKGGGVWTVRFRGHKASGGMIQELCMLRAAELAREKGAKALLIVARRDTDWTLTEYGAYNPAYGVTMPQGFETEIDVLLVDPAAMPAGHAAEGWRTLDAAAVIAALEPLYHAGGRK